MSVTMNLSKSFSQKNFADLILVGTLTKIYLYQSKIPQDPVNIQYTYLITQHALLFTDSCYDLVHFIRHFFQEPVSILYTGSAYWMSLKIQQLITNKYIFIWSYAFLNLLPRHCPGRYRIIVGIFVVFSSWAP